MRGQDAANTTVLLEFYPFYHLFGDICDGITTSSDEYFILLYSNTLVLFYSIIIKSSKSCMLFVQEMGKDI